MNEEIKVDIYYTREYELQRNRGVHMEYPILSELYYKDREAYKTLYEKRYQSEYAIHLDFQVNGNNVFFIQTPEINRMLTDILRMNTAGSNLCSILPGAAIGQFSRRCLIDEIVLTNSIEGVRSTRKEISDILDELEEKSKGKRFFGLVQKYDMLMTKEEIPIESCQNIRDIYDELVLREVEEENPYNLPDGKWFRKESVSIYSPSQKEIHKGVYPEENIIQAMEKALAFLHDESHEALCRIAIFHYLLEYIHPFYDGNGRLGRFICSYLLSQELVPVTGYRLSYTIKENINDYYKAFTVCNNPLSLGDLTPFLRMFLNLIKTSVEKLKESLQEGFVRLNRYWQRIGDLCAEKDEKLEKIYSLLIQAALFSEFGVSTDVVLEYAALSRTTLTRKLEQMPKNLLVKTKHGKTNYYSINLNELDQYIARNTTERD